jgi:hypothetical protein
MGARKRFSRQVCTISDEIPADLAAPRSVINRSISLAYALQNLDRMRSAADEERGEQPVSDKGRERRAKRRDACRECDDDAIIECRQAPEIEPISVTSEKFCGADRHGWRPADVPGMQASS